MQSRAYAGHAEQVVAYTGYAEPQVRVAEHEGCRAVSPRVARVVAAATAVVALQSVRQYNSMIFARRVIHLKHIKDNSILLKNPKYGNFYIGTINPHLPAVSET